MRRVPLIVTLKFQTKLVVVHSQVPVASARHRLWRYLLNLLGNDANIGRVAAVIAETVQAKPIVEITNQNDVVLQSNIRAASAAATAATATAATARHSATAAAAVSAHAAASTATTTSDVRVLPAASAPACCAVRGSRFCALP